MLKAIEKTPPRFSVFEMWDMDASLAMNILTLVTNLCLTTLQFFLA